MDMNIDQKQLIKLVKERPTLWDKSLEEYKSKRMTYEAWRSVCTNIIPDYETQSEEMKNEFGKIVMKKWHNLKDSWIKCHKNFMRIKSTSRQKCKRKYIRQKFYDDLLFLDKLFESQAASNAGLDETRNVYIEIQNYKNKKRIANNDNEITAKITKAGDDSSIMHFFKSVAPSIDLMNDEDFIEFQYQVLKVIKDIRQKDQSLVSSNCQDEIDGDENHGEPTGSLLQRCPSTSESSSPEVPDIKIAAVSPIKCERSSSKSSTDSEQPSDKDSLSAESDEDYKFDFTTLSPES